MEGAARPEERREDTDGKRFLCCAEKIRSHCCSEATAPSVDPARGP